MIAFVWVFSITITLPPTFEFLTVLVYTEKTHHCSPRWQDYSYYIILFTVIFGVTVPVMIISYACIIYHIQKSDRQLRIYDGMKTSANISKQLSGSKCSGSLQRPQNLGSNAFRDSHRCRLPQPTDNTQHASFGKHNNDGVSEARLSIGFQGDDLDLHEIVIDEKEARRMVPGPSVISGRICSLSATQSLPIVGPSIKDSDSRTNEASHSNGQRETGSTHSRSRAVENGPHARVCIDSEHHAHLDNALNKLSARKLRVDKRVAVTGKIFVKLHYFLLFSAQNNYSGTQESCYVT